MLECSVLPMPRSVRLNMTVQALVTEVLPLVPSGGFLP